MTSPQSFTTADTAVIQRARRKRREVIVLREDADWLSEHTASPKDMLRRMAARGALIPLGAGRYAIPIIGSASPNYKAFEPMLDARLAPLGDYYLGGFSAQGEHHLTDLAEPDVFVVVGFWHSALAAGKVTVAGRRLRAVTTRRAVFSVELGVERVRVSRTETYRRSDRTRTLVDCLWHPKICGAPETWVTAWGRAASGGLDLEAACRYALALGPSVACRVGMLLDLLGHGDTARRKLGGARRSGRVVALVADSDPLPLGQVDVRWNVRFNIPRERVEGWLRYGK